MPATPVPGQLFIAPTAAAGASGTRIIGIHEDRIAFDDATRVEAHGSGLEADAWTNVRVPGDEPPALIVPVRNVSENTLRLLLAALSTGTAMHSHGGQSTPMYGTPPGAALIVRPRDTTQLYLHGPRWSLHPRNRAQIRWHKTEVLFEGSELILMPKRSLDGSKRAFMWDTPVSIDAHYFA